MSRNDILGFQLWSNYKIGLKFSYKLIETKE